jgi:CDP-glucose 4,6-dehydratase
MESSWHGKRVLITGANGFVGGWVARALVDQGAVVVAPLRDQVPGAIALHRLDQAIISVRGDVADTALMARLLNEYEIDTVFHLAAQSLVSTASRHPSSTFESNIRGTWVLLEQCRLATSVARVVVSTSDKVYGDQTGPVSEEAPLLGQYPYEASKVCADVIARCYAATYRLPVTVVRAANIYGGGDLNYSRIVPYTIQRALRGETVWLRSSGTLCREYIHVDDAVRALLSAAQASDAAPMRGRAFNCGSGETVAVMALVQRIVAIVGNGVVEIAPAAEEPREIVEQRLVSSNAQRDLAWRPTVSLDDGLRRTVAWYRAHLGSPS